MCKFIKIKNVEPRSQGNLYNTNIEGSWHICGKKIKTVYYHFIQTQKNNTIKSQCDVFSLIFVYLKRSDQYFVYSQRATLTVLLFIYSSVEYVRESCTINQMLIYIVICARRRSVRSLIYIALVFVPQTKLDIYWCIKRALRSRYILIEWQTNWRAACIRPL